MRLAVGRPGVARLPAVCITLALLCLSSESFARQTGPDVEQLRGEAVTALREQRFEVAIERFESLVARQPEEPALWSNLGYCYRRVGRREDAREAFERALALNPEDAYALLQLGHLAWEAGDLRRAESLYERSLAIDPEPAAVRENLEALRRELRVADRVEAHRGRVTAAFWLAIACSFVLTAAGLWWGRRLVAADT